MFKRHQKYFFKKHPNQTFRDEKTVCEKNTLDRIDRRVNAKEKNSELGI